MSIEWIKFRKSLLRDGRVLYAKRRCNASSVTVIGGLVTLWSIADDFADENGLLFGYTKEDINRQIGIENFCESLPEDWIDLSGEFVKIPNYQEHNGATAKKRAVTQKRVQKHRNLKRKCNAKKVTKALPEKKRKEVKDISNISNEISLIESTEHDKVKKIKIPPCPQKKIIESYHRNLPSNPRVEEWGVTQERNLKARWRSKEKRQNVEWWDRFFQYVASCDFLVGKVDGGQGAFFASLRWLVKPENFAKVLEGFYNRKTG
jgi:hypothetical protein